MRHPSTPLVPRALFTTLLCAGLPLGLAAAGCKKKDEAPAEGGAVAGAEGADATEGKDPAEGAEAPGSADAGATLPVLDTPLEHTKGEVFGHVLLANPSQTLARVKGYAPPEVGGFLDEAALKALLGMQLGERAKVIQNLDLQRAHGCAVLDVETYAQAPVICAIAYTGGATQLVSDLGDKGKQETTQGHVAIFQIEGQNLFVDAIGDYAVVSGHPDVFDKSKDYLEKNIIARGSAPRGDVEVVAYVSDIFSRYQTQLQPFIDQMTQQQDLGGATADPRMKELSKLYSAYNRKNAERTVRQFKELDQVALDLRIDERGLMMGMTMLPAKGSEAAGLAAKYGGGKIDPELAASAPKGSWMLLAVHNERGAWRSDQAQDALQLMAEGWAALSGRDAAAGRAALDAFLGESEALYSNDSLIALSAVDGGLFGAVMVTPTKKPTRDAWLAWSAAFTPESVLGKEAAAQVNWSFEPAHADIDGVKVDRWTIAPSDTARKALEKDMSDKDRAQLEKYVGELALVIDRAEIDGRVAWTMAPKASDTWTRRVVEAQRGKDSLKGDPGLKAAVGYHPGANMTAGIDINGAIDWLRGLPDLESELAQVPRDLGDNLGDLMFVMEYRKDGVTTLDFVIGAATIRDGVKAAGALTGRGQGLGGI